MRFLIREHQSIRSAIESKGLPYRDFSFIKKHGRLNIRFRKEEPVFTFFRKTQTLLDEQNQWVKKTTYHLQLTEPEGPYDDWQEVLTRFKAWLAMVSKNGDSNVIS